MAKRKVNPKSLANLKPIQPGEARNPAGRPTAGASVREWINVLAAGSSTEAELRSLARDAREPWAKRTAAERMIRTLEAGDLADMEPYLNGTMSIAELRASGVNTEVVKKAKTKKHVIYADGAAIGEDVEREVELFDRAGADFDRVVETTDGRPEQRNKTEVTGHLRVVNDLV